MIARTNELPETQTALVAGPNGDFTINTNAPVIEIEPDAVIIKTEAVALNPVDTKMMGDFITEGAIFGFDCAGKIVAIGSEVDRKDLAIGDRVCGCGDSMNRNRPRGGAFAEYVSLPADLTLKIPDFVTTESAAAMGTGLASCVMALFFSLGLPVEYLEKPCENPFPVLVYGGSSATGTMAIQLLKLCGLRPITTCSKKNFDFVKSYGAEEAFDYKSPTVGQDIRTYTKNTLGYCFDTITQDSTVKICFQAIGRAGGKYTALDPYNEKSATRKVVKADWVLATDVAARGCSWPAPYGREGKPEIRKAATESFKSLQKLFDEGKLRSHPPRVNSGGFEALIEGVGMVRRGEVSGEKLVFHVP